MCFTRGGKFWVKGGRERLSFVDPSQSRTTIQVNLELDLKSTADLTSSQVATSLQVKFELHFNRHSDFTPSETRRSLLGCFGNEWRGTCLEVIAGARPSWWPRRSRGDRPTQRTIGPRKTWDHCSRGTEVADQRISSRRTPSNQAVPVELKTRSQRLAL